MEYLALLSFKRNEIIGSEANMLTFLFVSNRKITEGALDNLRNQTVVLGGNSVRCKMPISCLLLQPYL